MAELKVRKRKDLKNQQEPFAQSGNYQKACKFDTTIREELEADIEYIENRNEQARKEGVYNGAKKAMNSASSKSAYKAAADSFQSISDYKDAAQLAEQCLEKAEICRKDAVYESGISQMNKMTVSDVEQAIKTFKTIPGWKDADKKITECESKIEQIKAKEEADRIAAEKAAEEKRIAEEKAAEEKRIAAEKAAKKKKKIIAIALLAAAVIVAFVIVLTTVIIPGSNYNKAMELYNAGKYEEAASAFEEAHYKDSAEKTSESKYQAAMELFKKKEFVDGYEALIALNGYKDSREKATECLKKKKKDVLSNISKNSTIKFGFYEQDNNTFNGKEDIEWLVLAKESNKVLVISKYALDCQKYNSTYTDITWEDCSLRKWLNETFYNEAFGEAHKKLIVKSTVSADKNPDYSISPGNNTTDNVFLLSIKEVNKYFGGNSARQCQGTACCYAHGAEKGDNGNCLWWLRSPGQYSFCAAAVGFDGSVNKSGYGVDHDYIAVRPALWINLDDVS